MSVVARITPGLAFLRGARGDRGFFGGETRKGDNI
jgi:hypothetical protein